METIQESLQIFVRRFGLTATLVLNPLIMIAAFAALIFAPTVFMVQLLQVVRRVTQYAIARPSREICFAVLDQETRYKAKNVIDTVVYRFGDVSSAWMQGGLRAIGYGLGGTVAVGVGAPSPGVRWRSISVADMKSSVGNRSQRRPHEVDHD